MNYGYIVLVAIAAMIVLPGFVSADWLPNQTPENQVFSIDTVIDAHLSSITEEVNMRRLRRYELVTEGNLPRSARRVASLGSFRVAKSIRRFSPWERVRTYWA